MSKEYVVPGRVKFDTMFGEQTLFQGKRGGNEVWTVCGGNKTRLDMAVRAVLKDNGGESVDVDIVLRKRTEVKP